MLGCVRGPRSWSAPAPCCTRARPAARPHPDGVGRGSRRSDVPGGVSDARLELALTTRTALHADLHADLRTTARDAFGWDQLRHGQLEAMEPVMVQLDGVIACADGAPDPREAAETAAEVAESRRRVEQSRVEMMRAYAETTGCRRQLLLAYFGERLDAPCGRCDTCAAGTAGEAADCLLEPLERTA